MMGSSRHVARKTPVQNGVFGGLQRSTHQAKRTTNHIGRPRGQTNAFFLLIRESIGEKTLNVIFSMSEQQAFFFDGGGSLDVHEGACL